MLIYYLTTEAPWQHLKERIVTEQIESGNVDDAPTLFFYVESMGVRRELIPQIRDGLRGYSCVTITNVDPEPSDKIVATQTEFEAILVELRLMNPDAPSRLLADSWPTSMDNAVRGVNKIVGLFTGSRRLETWLPLLK